MVCQSAIYMLRSWHQIIEFTRHVNRHQMCIRHQTPDTRHQTATVYQLHQQTTMCSFLQEESVFDKYKSDKPMDIVLPRWVNGCLIQIQIQIQIHEKRKTTCGYCSSKVSPHEAGGWWGRCCLTVHLQQHHHDDDDDDGWSNDDSDDASPALWLPSHRSVSEKKK